MAQVTDSASGTQEALRSLQTGSPNRKENVRSEEDPSAQGKKSGEVRKPDETDQSTRSQSAEDRVQREARAEEGSRNEDNLRPVSEQRQSERGSAQVLENLEEDNARGARTREEAAVQSQPVETEEPAGNQREIQSGRAQSQADQAQLTRDQIELEASARNNPEVRLREFQTEGQPGLEPKSPGEAKEEIDTRAAKEQAQSEPILDSPSLRTLNGEVDEDQPRTTGQSNVLKSAQESKERAEKPSPTNVQTERGLNVDDLV